MRGQGLHVLVATAAALAKQLIPTIILFLDLAHRRGSPLLRVGALGVRGDALGRFEGGGALGATVQRWSKRVVPGCVIPHFVILYQQTVHATWGPPFQPSL